MWTRAIPSLALMPRGLRVRMRDDETGLRRVIELNLRVLRADTQGTQSCDDGDRRAGSSPQEGSRPPRGVGWHSAV